MFALYWFVARSGCGTSGALACPADPTIDEGVGVTLATAEICPRSGYLCVEKGGTLQIARWPLKKGKLRVRVPLPSFDFLDADQARQLRDAAVDGIKAWDG